MFRKTLADKLSAEIARIEELGDEIVADEDLSDDQRTEILDALEVIHFSLTDARKVCQDEE